MNNYLNWVRVDACGSFAPRSRGYTWPGCSSRMKKETKTSHHCLLLGRVVRLVIVYRPPCVNNNLFLDEFWDYLSLLVTAPGYLLLSGDFNFHVDDTCDRTARRFLDILQSFNLTQNISCSTHIAGQTLDLVITRCGEDFASSFEVSDPGISDHIAVKCKLQFTKPIPQTKKVFYRNLVSLCRKFLY